MLKCICVLKLCYLNFFLSLSFFPLSTETYEDFDSRVIEVSVTCPFLFTERHTVLYNVFDDVD